MNGKRYIGKAKNPRERWRSHISVATVKNNSRMRALHHAMVKPLYGVAKKTISDIKHNKTWKHVEPTEIDISNTNQILEILGDTPNPIKLNKEKAKEIRMMLADNIDLNTIAEKFNISTWTVKDIKNNLYYKENENQSNKITVSKLDVVQVAEIKLFLNKNELSPSQIARKFNVAPGTINKIKRGVHWKDVI